MVAGHRGTKQLRRDQHYIRKPGSRTQQLAQYNAAFGQFLARVTSTADNSARRSPHFEEDSARASLSKGCRALRTASARVRVRTSTVLNDLIYELVVRPGRAAQ